MHLLDLRSLSQPVDNWWTLPLSGLESLTAALVGPLPGGWVRQGDNFVRVGGGVKYGADARKIAVELSSLSIEANRIGANGGAVSILRAATFYHLRFENIHPLCEANGRIGRVILAGQLQQSLRIPMADTLNALKDWEGDYKRLFATNNPPLMFELLLDLLSRITGVPLGPEDLKLPASIDPLHPQKNIPKNGPRLHPEEAMKNPELLKKFAQQARRSPPNNFYRKFG